MQNNLRDKGRRGALDPELAALSVRRTSVRWSFSQSRLIPPNVALTLTFVSCCELAVRWGVPNVGGKP
jgi:hypothetical protein